MEAALPMAKEVCNMGYQLDLPNDGVAAYSVLDEIVAEV